MADVTVGHLFMESPPIIMLCSMRPRGYPLEELSYRMTAKMILDTASHLQIHMHAAVQAGATGEEILVVINLVGDWIGHVARIRALEAWRIYFRPDLPTIDRVIELRDTAK